MTGGGAHNVWLEDNFVDAHCLSLKIRHNVWWDEKSQENAASRTVSGPSRQSSGLVNLQHLLRKQSNEEGGGKRVRRSVVPKQLLGKGVIREVSLPPSPSTPTHRIL